MYVGITRAQKSLTITWCKKRKRAGEWQPCEPSRFLEEFPAGDVRHAGQPSTTDPAERKAQGQIRMAQIRAMLEK